MDKNKKNLPKEYWDNLQTQYPGYVDDFIQWAEERLAAANLTCVDHFYCFPISMQLGFFYEYVSLHHCGFDIDVTDFDECIAAMENYFGEIRENDLHEKQMFKNLDY